MFPSRTCEETSVEFDWEYIAGRRGIVWEAVLNSAQKKPQAINERLMVQNYEKNPTEIKNVFDSALILKDILNVINWNRYFKLCKNV
jgi:hypothetical protein